MPRRKDEVDDVWDVVDILADRIFNAFDRKRNLKNTRTIEDLRNLDWHQFEHLVHEAYRRMGYKVEHRGGAGSDGGIDLMVRSPNGTRHAIQCKRWKEWRVGGPRMREFLGALHLEPGVHSGIYVSCGDYTAQAREVAKKAGINLIDGRGLLELLKEVQTPVAEPPQVHSSPLTADERPPAAMGAVKAVDPSPPERERGCAPACPKCGSPMVLRTARRGANAGGQFYGCSGYPGCRGIVGIDD